MRFNHLFPVLFSISILLCNPLARAEPMLNGIGTHQELGQEIFIGALFSESLSNNAETLINNLQPMRMELKISAPGGLTTRSFSTMWIEGMALNNASSALTAQADNMVKFDGLFKGRFQKDDVITFANIPGKGVDIAVNGVTLGNIKDNAFFSMLLSTWIGKIPLSSEYRESLLKVGDVNSELRRRFDSVGPTASRVADIKAWSQPEVPEKDVKTVAVAVPKETVPLKTEPTTIAKVDLPKLEVPVIEKPALSIPAPVTRAAASASASTVAAKPATAVPTPKEEDEEDAAPALTAQSLLARQFYVSDAIKKIRGKTRYPQRALDRGQAGSVRVAIVIDRQGNILNTNMLEMSQFEILNKEAQDAIKRSAPFMALPPEIPGARFEFSVPIRWALPE
jgi:protein TonB